MAQQPRELELAPTAPSWFARCAGSGEKSWELPQPATRQAHQAPEAKAQFSAQLVSGFLLLDNPQHSTQHTEKCRLSPSEGEGRAGVGRGRMRGGKNAMEARYSSAAFPSVAGGQPPGRCLLRGSLRSSDQTLAFANRASEGSAVSPVPSQPVLPLAAVRSPVHRTASTRGRSSDLNFLHAVMSADIPHAHDTDGSSRMRRSPPRNDRALNTAR